MAIRLQKYLADCGVASRRRSEELIRTGRVAINGTVVTVLGTRIDPACDAVVCDGRPVQPVAHRYLMLHKPIGCVTTNADEHGRRTVFDLVPAGIKLMAVGRLDRDTAGLLLLTNDGEFANRVAHPRFGTTKTYEVGTTELPVAPQLAALREGVLVEGSRTGPAEVRLKRGATRLVTEIIVHEGRNRQVRRMFAAVGLNVIELVRTRVGRLALGTLAPGAWRELDDRDRELVLAPDSVPVKIERKPAPAGEERRPAAGRDPRRPAGERDRRRPADRHDPRRPSDGHDPRRPAGERDPRRPAGERDQRRPADRHDPRRPATGHVPRRPAAGRDRRHN
ncbi:MAG: pseudouridine synthase [Planctomycetota bacterium]